MSYQYSNPYRPASARQPSDFSPSRLTGYQVLFTGLPLNATHADVRDLLVSGTLRLSGSTTSVRAFHDADGQLTGMFLVEVGSEADAESIRREFTGRVFDGSYRLTVQHILHPSQPLSSARPSFPLIPTAAPTGPKLQPKQQKDKAPVQPAHTKGQIGKATSGNDKPPGLKLLARIGSGKPGQPGQTKNQLALIAKQKANLQKRQPGNALLSRLTKSKAVPASAVSKAKTARASSGAAKVGRAKANAASMAMDMDKVPNAGYKGKKEKAKPQTQAELDAEMALWERARRFAAPTA